jgi:hypothetical protein
MSGNINFNGWLNDDGSENYKCRAWVNFNGTGTVAIRASGNVSSITDNGTGRYTVNLLTAMPDTNYIVTGQAIRTGAYPSRFGTYAGDRTTTSFPFNTTESGSSWGPDCDAVDVAIFR